MPEGLLEQVKNYLDITWEDDAGDKKLTGIIERGMKYINQYGGATFDYSKQEKPLELLMDYVRYVRSDALDEFTTNYLPELLSLQIYTEIAGDIVD